MSKSEWKKIENYEGEKYELKHNNVLLGTIYHKPMNGKFSVWISSPLVVRKVTAMQTHSYEFKTFEEAKAQFDVLMRDNVANWAFAVTDYLKE